MQLQSKSRDVATVGCSLRQRPPQNVGAQHSARISVLVPGTQQCKAMQFCLKLGLIWPFWYEIVECKIDVFKYHPRHSKCAGYTTLEWTQTLINTRKFYIVICADTIMNCKIRNSGYPIFPVLVTQGRQFCVMLFSSLMCNCYALNILRV